jgi:hypothetical protein
MITQDIPQRSPIEIVEQGRVWVVEQYQQGQRTDETLSTHGTQIDAVRSAKTRMEAERRPCTVRWESTHSVSNVYWNPLFDVLTVRYDELLDAWTVAPAESTCAIAASEDRDRACKRAKQIQRDYNFKRLRACDRNGDTTDERPHRFLRHDITRSGVRFDPSAVDRTPQHETTSRDDTDTVAAGAGTDTATAGSDHVPPASPGQLGASIPDVTKVEFVDTDGAIHRYTTPWGDGTNAEIIAVSRKVADDTRVRDAFGERASSWRDTNDHAHVATIHESGSDPAQWIAYQVGERTLAAAGTDLPVDDRLSLLDQIADATEAIGPEAACGLHPERIHVQDGGAGWHATVADWGIEWAVRNATGAYRSTPFTAPEQLEGRLTPRTAVYQLGALAHLLLCGHPPFGPDAGRAAIQTGERRDPAPITGVGDAARTVINRALATDPADRYPSVEAFRRTLLDSA